LNVYRGCFHGCAYCYARPTHQYLDFGAGTDFERKIIVKVNAPELLRKEFLKKSWQGEAVAMSGITDCYQPLESAYRLTRRCLEVCAEFKNPVAIITKGALIRRDLDLLARLARSARVQVFHSIAFHDDEMSRLIEPGAPRPSVRFRAMSDLAAAGIPVGVAVAPIIPGLNESQIPAILEHAKACGARSAFMTLVRLPLEVKDVFLPRLKAAFPSRFDRVLHHIQRMKGGVLNRSGFGLRMRGDGAHWSAIEWMFEEQCRRLGLNERDDDSRNTTFERPSAQMKLL
jgi:DNA repair photolyase